MIEYENMYEDIHMQINIDYRNTRRTQNTTHQYVHIKDKKTTFLYLPTSPKYNFQKAKYRLKKY